jgi:hypothetical protein
VTECITDKMEFTAAGRRKVVADFGGGRLTSDAGVLLLREIDRRLGLLDAINAAIPDPREPSSTVHSQRTMLAQRIFSIALGYEDLNDQQTMRKDPALQAAAGVPPDESEAMASAPTLCRLENRITHQTNVALSKILVDQFIASYETPPDEIVLDFDATDDPVHGTQLGRFFHGYYRCYCFLPLYVFCGDQPLVAYLRPSRIDGAQHSAAILKLLVTYLRKHWPEVKIVLRGDGGFARWRMMRWCDKNQVHYVLGLPKNSRLLDLAQQWTTQASEQFEQSCTDESYEKQRVFGEFQYAAGSWDRERRVVVKAEHLPAGPNTRFIVTNLPGEPQKLYDELYVIRGDMENRIKEQQLMLFADRTSCHDFQANQFRLLLSTFAYVLLEALRRKYLAGTELAKAQAGTIRVKLLKIAARVCTSVRRVVFHLSSSFPWQALFRRLASGLLIDTG